MIDRKLAAVTIIAAAAIDAFDDAYQAPDPADKKQWTRRPVKVRIQMRPAPAKARGQALTGPGRGRRR